jgi:hypothetical protein
MRLRSAALREIGTKHPIDSRSQPVTSPAHAT